MDVDENPTPRSGRKKKSSALSRLAAQKGKSITPHQSFNNDGGDKAPKYPIDANVEIQNREERRSTYEEDSDEGIEMAGSTYNSSYGLNVKDSLKLDTSHGSTLKKFKHLKMDSVVSDDETGEKNYHPIKIKGEKRFRDANSSGEELAVDTGRVKGKKHPHSASDTMLTEANSSGERKVDRGDYSHRETRDPCEEMARHQMDIDEDLTGSRSFNVSHDAPGRTKIGERDQSPHIDTCMELGFYGKNAKKRENDKGLLRSNNCKDDDMDKTFTLKKGLNDSYDMNNQSLAERYRDSLADQEFNNVKSHEKNERYDNLGDLRPGSSTSPPPTFSRNYSGSSLQASVLNSIDKPWSSMQRISSGGTDVMSERSYQSTSVLPLVSTKDVKERSFLVGSMNSRTSLLGSEELDRLFPDRKMKVFLCTWNMCEMKDLPENLDDFLLPDAADYIPDAYVVGTQESTPNRKEWEIRLQETLGPNHVLFHSASFGVLYLSIFLRRDLIWFCSVVEEGNISTRPGPSGMKTKGAVAVSFTFFGSSLLFVNAHLTPHDGKAKERAADYHKINRGLNLPKNVGNKSSPKKKNNDDGGVTSRFDCVFWSGDLNFRLEKERERLDRTIEGIEAKELPDFTDLMVHDELFRIRNEELAFQDFQEGRIKFKPTYKYDIGTDKFDTSKKMRIPSYTDRILFRCKRKNSISCLHYGAVETLKESDHRPVFGVFEVELRPGRDNITLSGGQFERDIWLQGNRRRAERLDNKKRSQKQSTVCSIQ